MATIYKLDAAETVFFNRELEQILVEMFNVKYAELKARQFLPVDNSIDPGAESFTYDQFDQLGSAKKIADYSADLPLVNVKGKQFTQRVQSYGAAFGYSIQEIRAAAKVGRPLDRLRAETARRVLDVQLDNIAFQGDSSAGLVGLANLAAAQTATAGTKTGGGTTWTGNATPDEIIKDLNLLVSTIVGNTQEVERPTRILLPTAQFLKIQQTARSSTSDTTILNFFLANNPGIEVRSWVRLAAAGAGSTPRAIAYNPDPSNVRLVIPVEFEQLPPEPRNLSWVVNCHMRAGGVIAPYPKSVCYMDAL